MPGRLDCPLFRRQHRADAACPAPGHTGATAAALVSPFYKALHREVTLSLFQQHVNAFPDFVQQSIRARTARPPAPDVLQRMTRTACEHFGCYVWTEFWRLYAGMPFLPCTRCASHFSCWPAAMTSLRDCPTSARWSTPCRQAGSVSRDAGHFLLNDLRHDAVGAIAQFLQVRGDPMPATPRQTCAGATPSFHSTESTP